MATALKRLVEKVYGELLSVKGEPQPAVGIPKRGGGGLGEMG